MKIELTTDEAYAVHSALHLAIGQYMADQRASYENPRIAEAFERQIAQLIAIMERIEL